jgi:hypothetical protein
MLHTQEHTHRESTPRVATGEPATGARTWLRPPAQRADVDHRHDLLWWALLIIAFIL